MAKPLVYLITFVVCLLLQVAVAPAIAIGGCSPNFLLIFVILVSLRSGAAWGSVAGFCCGLFEDFVGSSTIGCMALAFTLTALVFGLLGKNMTQSPLVSAVCAVISAFFVEIVYGVSVILTNSADNGAFATMVLYALPCALYTAVFAAIALATISLVLIDDGPAMPTKLGGGYGTGNVKMPRYKSRLK